MNTVRFVDRYVFVDENKWATLCGLESASDTLELDFQPHGLVSDSTRQRLVKPLHSRVFDISRRYPDAPCLCTSREDGLALSYGQLIVETSRVQSILVRTGKRFEGLRVGVLIPRGVSLIVTVLAVHGLGGVYVPLDPSMPLERHVSACSGGLVDIVATVSSLSHDGRELCSNIGSPCEVVEIDGVGDVGGELRDEDVVLDMRPAFVICTSGTTGVPKAVLYPHIGLIDAIENHLEILKPNRDDVFELSYSSGFDVHLHSIYCALVTGARLVVCAPDGHLDPSHWVDMVLKHKVTIVHTLPTLAVTYAGEMKRRGVKDVAVREWCCMGENFPQSLAAALYDAFPNISERGCINGYGPTETNVATHSFVTAGCSSRVSIGLADPNTLCLVIKDSNLVTEVGVTGELWVCGPRVALGYLFNDQKTKERFIDNPCRHELSGIVPERMMHLFQRCYRTGDLVSWMENGELEIHGRIDRQVKIRGVRIELGEVESLLIGCQAVTGAVADARVVNGEKVLLCWVTPETVDIDELYAECTRKLVRAAIPARIIPMKEFPVSATGKVHVKQLQSLDNDLPKDSLSLDTIMSSTMKVVVKSWIDALGMPVHESSDFFALGGNSLQAMKVCGDVQSGLSISSAIPITLLYDNRTLKRFHDQVITLCDAQNDAGALHHQNWKDLRRPLGGIQQQMWTISSLIDEESSAAYNISIGFEVKGDLDITRLEQALKCIVDRHEVLKTLFVVQHGTLTGRLSHQVPRVSLVHTTVKDLNKSMIEEMNTRFDLENDLPMHVSLIDLGQNYSSYLLIVLHHAVSDAWSLGIFCEELSVFYSGNRSLDPILIQYADYVAWLDRSRVHLSDALYWKAELQGAPEQLDFPLDFSRPQTPKLKGKVIQTDLLSLSAIEKLRALASKNSATLTSLMLAAFHVLLARWSNSCDVVVGVPVATRAHASIQRNIGCLINPLPIRGLVNFSESMLEFVKIVQKKLAEAVMHAGINLPEIIRACGLQTDVPYNPIYQFMFQLHEEPSPQLYLGEDVTVKPFQLPDPGVSQVDLSMEVYAHPDHNPYVRVEYATEILTESKVKQVIESYSALLEDICSLNSLSVSISEVKYLSDAQIASLANFSKGPECPEYFDKDMLHMSFLQKAIACGNSLCIKFAGRDYTYSKIADLVLHTVDKILTSYPGGVRGVCIAVFASRSLDLVVSMLAILFLGGVYLPIEPRLPLGRINEYLRDATVKLVLLSAEEVTKEMEAMLDETVMQHLTVNSSSMHMEEIEGGAKILESKCIKTSRNAVCCILFTSGSTGKPKGVRLHHKGLIDVVWGSYIDMYGVDSSDVFVLVTSPAFDPHIANTLAPLACGACLSILPPGLETDALAVSDLCAKDKVTFMDQVPSLVEIYAPELVKRKSELRIRILLFGGEPLPKETAAMLQSIPSLSDGVYNTYGPAEFSVVAACSKMLPGVPRAPLGPPDPNVRAYVVSTLDMRKLQPIGAIGELLLSGPRTALGYVNNKHETDARFIRNPFVKQETKMIEEYNLVYRTGDLVSWDENGELNFHGRADDQVKVSGVRIELGEVKWALSACEGVTSAHAVILKIKESKVLVGFVTPNDVDTGKVCECSKSFLIPAAVPSHVIAVEELPLTATGKVDLRKLQEIATSYWDKAVTSDGNDWFVPAQTATEGDVGDITRQVLGLLDDVSVTANFFQIGGNSLKAGIMSSKLRAHFNLPNLPATVVYQYKDIRSISAAIDRLLSEGIGNSSLESNSDRKRIESDKEISSTHGQIVATTWIPFWMYLILQYIVLAITMVMLPVIWGAMLVGVLELRKRINSWWLVLIWPSMQVASIFAYATLLIGLKWILVWKLKPGVYPVYGLTYLRWVTMRALQEAASTTFFPAIRRTPILSFLLKALGAKIQSPSTVILDSIDLKDFDLLSIGAGSAIYSDASVTGGFVIPASYLGRRPVLVLSEVDIGDHCHIGHSAVVSPGTSIPARHSLKPHASRAHPGDAPAYGPLSDYPHFIAEERFGALSSLFGGLTNHFLESLADVPIVALCLFIIYAIIGDENVLDSSSGSTIAWQIVAFSALFTGLHGWLDPSIGLILHMILVVCWKWIFVGKLSPGVDIARNSYKLFTYSVFRRMIESPKWQKIQLLLTGTNLMASVYRALGAKIGKHVFIGGLSIVEFDALDVGDLVCSGSDSWVFAANDDGIVEKIVLKNEATIGNASVLYPGCVIGNRSVVGNDTPICRGRVLGDHVRAQGSLDYAVLKPAATLDQAESGDIDLPFIVKNSTSHVETISGLPWWHNIATIATLFLLGPIAPILFWLPLAAVASALKNKFWWLIPIAYVVMVAAGTGLVVIYLRLLLEFSGVKKHWNNGSVSVFNIPSLVIHTYFDIASANMDAFHGTPFSVLIYRLLGFSVGKGAILLGPQPLESKLISIGEGTVIESGASVDGHYMEYQKFIYHKVSIGDECWIQEGARVMPFTRMENGSRVMPASMVLPGDTLAEKSIWCGLPAEPIGSRSEHRATNSSERVLRRASKISRSEKSKGTGFLEQIAGKNTMTSWHRGHE